ncbi:MDR/zinc-dependent alcohol dehydrogenase-like family protein [Bombilactobacillus thymidiniphilus]|uniref:NADPH:quinone reductase-like Zn-dependent oxidoreductase n=1 Tax=Bombilactobacillus thymidiniphilus TaxID=2923363 RepID=A0ABY4PD88_9LACO|nr:hypothetical protein [Bombilactobacillus thymidiniphilus]UQS83672.1 hypothetical protein MOO47_00270 [Bombilactobacillus thymidiniphilus]
MKAIIQSGVTGTQSIEISNVEPDQFLTTSIEVKTMAMPILPYDVMKLKGKIPVKYPNVMGYGAVGKVIRVGTLRSNKLLGKRILIFNPSGTYKERVISNFPPLAIPIPERVSNEVAATLIGGLDTSLVIYKKIKKSNLHNIVILGADSVIGLGVLQLLKADDINTIPIVRDISKDYFNKKVSELNLSVSSQSYKQSLTQDNTLIIDIAGDYDAISKYVDNGFHILSLVINNSSKINFVSEPILPKEYMQLLQKISMGELIAPINKLFPIDEVKEAFTFQSTKPSRGRNILIFS